MRNSMAGVAFGVACVVGCSSAPEPARVQAPALSDAEIAAVVVAANTIDAELGELAANRSASGPVQEFARTMARDHRAVNAGAVALVTKLGITPAENGVSRQLQADAAAFRAELEKTSGEAFDRTYIAHEVSYHTAVIDAVDQLLLPSAKNAELRKAIADVRPALVAHLDHARHLQSSLEQAR